MKSHIFFIIILMLFGCLQEDSQNYIIQNVDENISNIGSDVNYVEIDENYLRLDTTNDPLTGSLETDNGSILATNTASGILTLGASGGSNNENLLFDFETTANQVAVSSTTGAIIGFDSGLFVKDNTSFSFGSSLDGSFRWATIGNDNLQVAVPVGSATGSGYFSLISDLSIGNANRSPASTSADPIFRVYSADYGEANDYIEMCHDQTDAIIEWGNGGLDIGGVAFVDSTNERFGIGIAAPEGKIHVYDDSGDPWPGSFHRVTTKTADDAGVFRMIAESTGNMANGFGPGFSFAIADATQSEVHIAQVRGIRDNADNSGKLVFATKNSGVWTDLDFVVRANGNVEMAQDDVKFIMGAGSDVFLQFDGDSFNVKANNINSTNRIELQSDTLVDANFIVGNTTTFVPSNDQNLAASDTILVYNTVKRIVGNSAIVLVSTPTIIDGSDGQILILQGTSDTDTVTIQDNDSLANSGLQLANDANFTLGQNDIIQLLYDSGENLWIEVSRSNN